MPLSSDQPPNGPQAAAGPSRALHPAFDPDLNGLSAAEDAIDAELDRVNPIELRLSALQDQVLELRNLAICQQDLLKRLLDVLAGPVGG